MKMKMRARLGVISAAVAVVGMIAVPLATSTSVTVAGASSARCPYRFAVITHGDNGSFWSVVYKGAKMEAATLGCTLTEVYGSQQQGQANPDDVAENAQIQDAINAHVNGIAVSDHDPALMNPTLAKAVKAGIPVVLLNAGCDPTDIAASHALTCVGQPETLAGQQSGLKLLSMHDTNVLCVIHQSGQNLLDRCNGLAQGLGVKSCKVGNAPASGPACTELILSTPNAASNPTTADGQIISYLQAHPQVNAVMTLNNAIATALISLKPPKSVKAIATFDLNSGVQADIANGSLAFAVDQQQFLQGAVPIDILYWYNKYDGQALGGGTTVASGPMLVTRANLAKVSKAIAAGLD